jgi:hypothetical protein
LSTEPPRDIFSLCRHNIDEFFAGLEKFLPNYHQAITNLQQEWFQTCENTIKSIVSVQQEFASKTGLDTNVPEQMVQAIKDVNDEALKIYTAQTHSTLATIDMARQNIKTFNDNTEFFAVMNKNIAQYWASLFTKARN